jgi:hypothetical protein
MEACAISWTFFLHYSTENKKRNDPMESLAATRELLIAKRLSGPKITFYLFADIKSEKMLNLISTKCSKNNRLLFSL